MLTGGLEKKKKEPAPPCRIKNDKLGLLNIKVSTKIHAYTPDAQSGEPMMLSAATWQYRASPIAFSKTYPCCQASAFRSEQ